MNNPRFGFGRHLMVDGYNCNRDSLESVQTVHDFLAALPEEIGMTVICPPHVFRYKGLVPEDWGVTGFVVIAESHVSVHTYPEKGFLTCDVYSCREFDTDRAAERIKQTFGIGEAEVQCVRRGREFPITSGRASA